MPCRCCRGPQWTRPKRHGQRAVAQAVPAWKKYLEKNYFDPSHPASFKGPNKVYQVIVKEGKHKISMGQIRKWLQDQELYSLMKPVKRKIKRIRVIVMGLHDQYDVI